MQRSEKFYEIEPSLPSFKNDLNNTTEFKYSLKDLKAFEKDTKSFMNTFN